MKERKKGGKLGVNYEGRKKDRREKNEKKKMKKKK